MFPSKMTVLLRRATDLWLRWRLRHDAVAYARTLGVGIGENCRLIKFQRATFGSEPYLIRLGNHVTVAAGVRFVTHDGGVWVFREAEPQLDVFGPIVVEDNVFIGINAIILPGVTIGRDCVVAAGSVVTKDVPPGFLVAGVPERPLKTIAEYRAGLAGRESHQRHLTNDEKRRTLEAKFWGDR